MPFVDRAQAGALAGLAITADILMSLAIDHFGLLRMEVHPKNPGGPPEHCSWSLESSRSLPFEGV